MGFLGLLENGARGRAGTSSVINISSAAGQTKLSLDLVCIEWMLEYH